MAVVYRAWDRAAGRTCAIKVLGDLLSPDEEFRRRFRREAQAVVALAHPHIVTVYDWGEIPPHHYIAMEFVAGGTLQDLMRQQGRQGEAAALRIAAEVADALAYAHGRDLVHRDIKPHNILLTGDGHVKVADFGIARTLDATHLTATGMVMGSAHYISPEQARGDHAGPASDQYALGCVLFEMLAGDVPFTGEAPVAIALKHLHEPPPDLRAVRPDLSPATVALVERLLQKEPARRYASAAELAGELRRIVPMIPRDRVLDETAVLPHGRATEAGMRRDERRAAPSSETTHLPAVGAGGGSPPRPTAAMVAPGTVPDTRQMPVVRSPKSNRPPRAGMTVTLVVAACLAVLSLAAYRTAWLARHATVPSLVGRTVADAGLTILPMRLRVMVTGQRQDPRAAVGVILSQDPPPGSQVLKESVVRLTVSQGSGIVPDLRGLPVVEAAYRLEAAGLRLGRVNYVLDDRAASGTVVHQFAAPGTRVGPNGAVDVLVGWDGEDTHSGRPFGPQRHDDTRK